MLRSCVLPLLLGLPAPLVFAHGWVYSPPSRQQLCAAGTAGFDCGDIRWEPQSVEAPKGSHLCSGGGRFPILDQLRDWPVTSVESSVSFVWKLTAPHRTSTWDYWIDGRLFARFDAGYQVPSSPVTHVLSDLPAGRHTVLAIWNIGDTVNAFYSCVDLDVSGK